MTEILLLYPSLVACPVMGMNGILCACGIEIAIRLLRGSDDVDDGVDIVSQLLVGERLQEVGCSFDGLIRVGIIEAKAADGEGLRWVFHVLGGMDEVHIAPCLLALAEGEGYRRSPAGFQPLSPESAGSNLDRGERHGVDGITGFLCDTYR